jgi:Family of unknown function (DUF6390)
MSVPGSLLFARYAYPPNELGYCGPDGAAALLRADAPDDIAGRARQFDGAWAYLEFLAETAGIVDPLDEAVVEAYWIGNDLLDEVNSAALVTRLHDRFQGQLGGTWREAAGRAAAHHSFHVFEVYPWAAMLQRNPGPVAVSVLDRCRIRTGIVLDVSSDTAIVRSNPLTWNGTALVAGPAQDETVRWSSNGLSLLPGLAPGNLVTLHWDWLCDIITDRQRARVDSLEARQLSALASVGSADTKPGDPAD